MEDRESATVFLILAALCSLLGGWLGSILGFFVYYAKDAAIDPESHRMVKFKKYKESHRKAGLIIGIMGIISWIVWLFIIYS